VPVTLVASHEFRYDSGALFASAYAIDSEEGIGRQERQAALDGLKATGDPALHDRAGLVDIEAEHGINIALPKLLGMLCQQFAGFKADAVIIHAEVDCAWVRDIDGDQGNAGSGYLVGDDGRGVLIDLKLDNKVHSPSNEFFRHLDRGCRVVAIIKDNQFNSGAHRGIAETGRDCFGKGHFTALLAKAKTGFARARNHAIQTVLRIGKVPSVDERFENSVGGRFRNLRLAVNGFQRQRLIVAMQHLENVQRLGQHRNEVRGIESTPRHGISLRRTGTMVALTVQS
jgi:hypothetical protein